MAHLNQHILSAKINQIEQNIEVGGLYYHYKNPNVAYHVIAIGVQEADEQLCVIYQNRETNCIWVRNVSSWFEKVQLNGNVISRFKKIN